jgi:hypothetical protein
MFLQPLLAYQATRTVTLTAQSEMTANWEADDKQWTVPLNFIVSKLSSFGTFPATISSGSVRLPPIWMSDRRGRSAPPASSCCGEREINQ